MTLWHSLVSSATAVTLPNIRELPKYLQRHNRSWARNLTEQRVCVICDKRLPCFAWNAIQPPGKGTGPAHCSRNNISKEVMMGFQETLWRWNRFSEHLTLIVIITVVISAGSDERNLFPAQCWLQNWTFSEKYNSTTFLYAIRLGAQVYNQKHGGSAMYQNTSFECNYIPA